MSINQTKKGEIYQDIGNGQFLNLRTLGTGTLTKEEVSNTFVVNSGLTVLIGEFPNIKTMINKLDLRIENS
jgi:hypothetical protein